MKVRRCAKLTVLVVERVVQANDERVRLVSRAGFQNRLFSASMIEFAVSEDLQENRNLSVLARA